MNLRLVKNVEGTEFYRRDMSKIAYWLIGAGKKIDGTLSFSGGGLTDDPYFKLDMAGDPKDGDELRQSEVIKMFGQPQTGQNEMKESIEMSEDTRNEATVSSVINMIRQGNNLKAEEAFKVVMDQKIGAAVRAKTPEVAQSMFNSKER